MILVGPASPRDLAVLLTGRDQRAAEAVRGYRGIPVSELAKALVATGAYVEVATLAGEVDAPTEFEGDRFRLHVSPMRERARERARDAFARERQWLEQAIQNSEAKLVHAHWTYEFAWAALNSGQSVVVTAHDAPLTILGYYRDRYRLLRTAMAYAVRLRIHNLTAVSPYLATAWRRQMLYRRTISVIPNVIHVARVAPTCTTTTPHEAVQTVLAVADDSARKNVETLVRSIPRILSSHPCVRFRLVGPGLTGDSQLGRMASALGVSSAIDFAGPVDSANLARAYSQATVFVHPSLEESFGLTVAEAMSQGLPVIVGNTAGALPWMLDAGQAGQAGLTVDVRKPQEIAEGVCGLLDDQSWRSHLGAAARRRVRATFSPEVVVPKWAELYERIIDGS